MTPLDILNLGRARIAQGWTQHAWARTKTGAMLDISTLFQGAVCWCAEGALMLTPIDEQRDALALLRRAALGSQVSEWNDERGRTQADVLGLFDRAIAMAQECTA